MNPKTNASGLEAPDRRPEGQDVRSGGCRCARACVSYNSGFKGRLDFPLLQQDPVDLSEEGVALDGLLAALGHHAAQTLGRVLGHELHTNTSPVKGSPRRSEPNGAGSIWLLIIERGINGWSTQSGGAGQQAGGAVYALLRRCGPSLSKSSVMACGKSAGADQHLPL